jgi:hypothetical protein
MVTPVLRRDIQNFVALKNKSTAIALLQGMATCGFNASLHGMGPAPEVWSIDVSALALRRHVQNFVAWHGTSTRSLFN